MNANDPRKYVKIAAGLFYEAIATGDPSLGMEATVEYRQVLRLLGIDPDSGGPHDDSAA